MNPEPRRDNGGVCLFPVKRRERACMKRGLAVCAGLHHETPPGIRVALRVRGSPVMLERTSAMAAQDFASKTPDQLKDQLVALKKEAFNLRFQQATGQLENTARMRAVRRDVARVKTILNQKAAEAAASN